jgi:cytochrome b
LVCDVEQYWPGCYGVRGTAVNENRGSVESEAMSGSAPAPRVWDLPVRVTHALLIASIAGAWLTRHADRIDAHAFFGYAATLLVAFRIAWGFLGTRHARFADFAYSPAAALAYLRDAMRGRVRHYTGHNPAGSWSVYLLLAAIAAACATGMAASAGMHAMGPLAALPVGEALARGAWRWHEALAWAVLAIAAAHVAGVAWGSRVHRENLVAAMVTGRKRDHGRGGAAVPARAAVAGSLAAGVCAIAILVWTVLAPRDVALREAAEKTAARALAATAWGKECSSCHLAYAPAVLPMRSWVRTLEEQDRHFGEDLSLSASAAARLLDEARAAAAPSWAARALADSAPPDAAPLRVTEVPYWRRVHARVPREQLAPPWASGPHECEACHADAHSGKFHPRMIRKAKPRIRS